MTMVLLVAGGLAVWRITHLIVVEDGPWALLRRMRQAASTAGLDRLVNCFLCCSVWVAVPVALLIGGRWRQIALAIPALSGAAILLERATAGPDAPPLFEEREAPDGMLRK
jgi:hypothetical protein